MAMTVRALLRLIAGSVAALLGRSTISVAQERSASGAMAALIARLRSDSSLRARFLENPGALMREQGIDPTPFRLPERVTQAQLDHLLADWSRTAGSQAPAPGLAQAGPPAVVYGPPPGPPRTQQPQPLPPAPVYGPPPSPPRTEGQQPNPPAPVYGPPPRPPR